MTEYEYILADLVICKMPINQPFSFNGMYHNILIEKHDKYPQQTINEIHKLIVSNTSSIRTFCLEQGYIKCIDFSLPKDISEPAGKKAKELGGHTQYLEYLKKQQRKSFIIDFPKDYWYIVAIFAALFGFFTDIFKDNLKNTKSQTSQQDTTQLHKTIEILRDSVQYMLHQQKETLYIQKNALSQPKKLNK